MIACLHIPEYPLWVCRQIHPGRPDLALHDGTRVLAASAVLGRAGLRPGESLDRARILFPEASFHERDIGIEEAMWEDLLHLFQDLSPRLLPLRSGTVLLEPWDRAGLGQMARSLPARVGMARRHFLAELAALLAPDRGVSEVSPELVGRLYDRSPVGILRELGFEEEMVERFRLFGLTSLGRLHALTRRHLEAQFGREGKRLFELLHPTGDDPPVPEYTPPPSIVASHDCDYPIAEPGDLFPLLDLLDLLVAELAARLADRRARLLTLRLTVRGPEGGVRVARHPLKEPTARRAALFAAAERLLRPMLGPGVEIERLAVELRGLVEPTREQGALFAERPELLDTLRTLHLRFPGTVLRAVIEDPDPVRPEEGIRYEPFPAEPPPPAGRGRPRR